ncbi:ATP-binding protein [Nocardioides sp. cx-173]|uniref:sensor histidine kinase n=1 Tax=Nocardioides sp. cx-173 TaxID=2898796 RepID=UPI001E3FA9E3|nr:ATP-binding protein [Nocardioides sp. cx-173]MCD4525172.1 ATP-binding protein [Nocardioides sp. cx-173]UGB40131.1 ATP-binding protein [Nocardioides sp. cx-173]
MRSTPWAVRSGPLGVTLGYVAIFCLSVLSVHFAPLGSEVATWWPAAGVGVALVVLSPVRHWPLLLGGIVVVTGVANAVAGRSPEVAALFGVGNASECLVAALVLGVHRRPFRLRAPEDLPRVLLAIVAGAVSVGTVIGATVTLLRGAPFLDIWGSVAAAHGAATLLMLPLVLMAGDPQARASDAPRAIQFLQAAATIAAFAVVHHGAQPLPLAFLPLPLLVWGAQVLSPRALALEVLTAGVVVTAFAAADGGPFGSDPDLTARSRDVLVQLDLVVIALASVPLSLYVSQRRAGLRTALAVGETYRRSLIESVIATMLLRPARHGLVVVDLNEPAGDLLGVRRDDLLGRDWVERLGSHGDAVVEAARQMMAGERGGWEEELALAGEPVRCVRLALSWVPDTASGDLVVAQLVDLTEQREAQRELERERDFNAALLAATTGTSIIATDPQGRITYVNHGTRELLGFGPEDLRGRRLAELYDPAELRERAEELTADLPKRGDRTLVGADGRRLLLNVNVTPIRAADGTLMGHLQVGEDVTERALAEETLRGALDRERQAVEELERLDRSKSDFLATVSHELRTPLTSIMGFNEMLAAEAVGPVNDQQLRILNRGSRAGQRLLGLIENILTLSRVESLADSSHHVTLDLADVVTHALESTEPLEHPGLEVSVDLPESGPHVVGDAVQLERALVNVVSNALKFSPRGGRVQISLETDPPGASPGLAVVTVSDTGIGIPAMEQDRLFERFFRASSAVVSSIPGTGLGLAIVRTIVEGHGGTVTVTSQPGEGTTVRISLPRAVA